MGLDCIRKLEWYKKQIDDLFDSEDITSLSADHLKEILGVGDEDDPELILIYSVPEEHAQKLQQYIKHKIDLEKYDYFIGCYAKK